MNEVEHSFRDKIMKTINKDGERLFYLGQQEHLGTITNTISTQAPFIDRIISKDSKGGWGIPCGRMTFIVGLPSSGKTTLCKHLCAETQRRNGIAIYIDGEHRYDKPYATTIGINNDTLLYCTPHSLEDAFDVIKHNIQTIKKEVKSLEKNPEKLEQFKKMPILIVFDGISIGTEAELAGGKEKGGHARVVSQAMRVITPDIYHLNIAIVFVCQQKSKIQIGFNASFGDQETWLAEKAIRFHCSAGIKTIKIKTLKGGSDIDNKIGDVIKTICIKNSLLPPFRTATAEIYYGEGIDYHINLCDTLVRYYGATINGRTYKLKDPDLEWVSKGGLKKLFENNKHAERMINRLLRKPARGNS
jgi:recombination protein RecA